VARLAEICYALGVYPHEVLARVHERLYAGGWNGVQVNLVKVVNSTQPELLPLRKWAADQLRDDSKPRRREVALTAPAVERMAELCGLDAPELLAQLRQMSAVAAPR
jgi:hypothetical protein